jgi:hypothetical protein
MRNDQEAVGKLSAGPLADSFSSLYTTGFPIQCGLDVLAFAQKIAHAVELQNQDRSKSRLELKAETG